MLSTNELKAGLSACGAGALLAGLLFVLAGNAQRSPDPPLHAGLHAGPQEVGDAACFSCHQEIAESYRMTAHHQTSSAADKDSIAGSFAPGKNTLSTSNPDLHFAMTETERGFFQTAVLRTTDAPPIERKERFDLVIGSNRKGQSYLFWQGELLFQLPVSYWAELGRWINSPGYADGSAHFDRPVVARCLECHSSRFEAVPPTENQYRKEGIQLGITCERCHGPGAAHIALQRSAAPPAKGVPQQILNPARFPRDRQIDACALCHAGIGVEIAPAFSFRPGEVLEDYLFVHRSGPGEQIDVHGNQVEPLKGSRCFTSTNMTCSTCHNTHVQQRDAAAYSGKCLTCHEAKACGKFATLGPPIAKNCVDCHMPLQESQTLIAFSKDEPLKPKVRSHHIAVYPDGITPNAK